MLYVNDISINLEKCITHNQLIVQRHLKCSLPTSTPLFCLASIPTSEAWGAGGIETKSHMIRHVWALAWSQRSGGQWWSNDKSPCETAASFIWSHSNIQIFALLHLWCSSPVPPPPPLPKEPRGPVRRRGGVGVEDQNLLGPYRTACLHASRGGIHRAPTLLLLWMRRLAWNPVWQLLGTQ